eukprot:386428_1
MAVSFVFLFYVQLTAVFIVGSYNCDICSNTDFKWGTIGDVVNELTNNFDAYWPANNIFVQWIDQHINNSSLNETNCESTERLLKSFISNSLYSLYVQDIMGEILFYDNDNIENTFSNNDKKLKLVINKFVSNDVEHYKLYLNDWKNLGLDKSTKKFSDLLTYLWSNYTLASRRTVYETIRIDMRLNGEFAPQNRYIIISILEYSTNYVFSRLRTLTKNYNNHCDDSINFLYIGHRHINDETQHINITKYFHEIDINYETYNLLIAE